MVDEETYDFIEYLGSISLVVTGLYLLVAMFSGTESLNELTTSAWPGFAFGLLFASVGAYTFRYDEFSVKLRAVTSALFTLSLPFFLIAFVASQFIIGLTVLLVLYVLAVAPTAVDIYQLLIED
jgi:hypothetical protein